MFLQSIALSAQSGLIYLSELREVSGFSPTKLSRLKDNMPNELKNVRLLNSPCLDCVWR